MSKKANDSKGKTRAAVTPGANRPANHGGVSSLGRPSAADSIDAARRQERHGQEVAKGGGSGTSDDTTKGGASAPTSKRKLGLRGAAPWAARHAAKHAAEARARAAQPPPPGSARATIRVPTGAEEIKAKIAELHNALVQIRASRKNLAKGFYDVGVVLRDIQQRRLYEAKGYGSFEAFLEREIDLGKTTALKLLRVPEVFVKGAALEFGMDRVLQAMQTLDSAEASPKAGPAAPISASMPVALPLKPPVGRVG